LSAVQLTEADEQRVVRAIATAERENRGEVRVHLEVKCPSPDPTKRARQLYEKLKLDQTREDTGVLLYVATGSKVCAVWSGAGLFSRPIEGFWKSVTDVVAQRSREGKLADGLVEALGKIGELLRKHLGGQDRAGNEVPDAVTTEASEP
jgi:uncharacterized membrane protein